MCNYTLASHHKQTSFGSVCMTSVSPLSNPTEVGRRQQQVTSRSSWLLQKVWEVHYNENEAEMSHTSSDILLAILCVICCFVYHIAGRFQGRKLLQIGEKYDLCRENFRGLFAFAALKDVMLPNFMEKIFSNTHKILQNSWKFSPSKVSRYMIFVSEMVLVTFLESSDKQLDKVSYWL